MKTNISSFESKQDFLEVTEWICDVKETFELNIASGEHISEGYIILYADRLFKAEVLDWCLSLGTSDTLPTTRTAFEQALKTEFIPADYERSIMNGLKIRMQKGSAVAYVKDFRRLIIFLPEIS